MTSCDPPRTCPAWAMNSGSPTAVPKSDALMETVSPQAMGCAWLNVQPSASESAIVSGEAKALLRVALAAA